MERLDSYILLFWVLLLISESSKVETLYCNANIVLKEHTMSISQKEKSKIYLNK